MKPSAIIQMSDTVQMARGWTARKRDSSEKCLHQRKKHCPTHTHTHTHTHHVTQVSILHLQPWTGRLCCFSSGQTVERIISTNTCNKRTNSLWDGCHGDMRPADAALPWSRHHLADYSRVPDVSKDCQPVRSVGPRFKQLFNKLRINRPSQIWLRYITHNATDSLVRDTCVLC